MSTAESASPRPIRMQGERASTALTLGLTTTYLSLIVALPIAALIFESTNDGARPFGTWFRARRRSQPSS